MSAARRFSRLDYATTAADKGWSVFPLTPGGKAPLKGLDRWEERATTDRDRIRAAWTQRPDCNIGVATGPSGLVVVDLDRPKPGEVPPPEWDLPGISDGMDVLAVLCERHGEQLPLETFMVTTRSGGVHLYFTAPPGVRLGCTTGRRRKASGGRGLGWLVDTRAHGGYVVGPGSHVDLPDGAGAYDVVHRVPPAPLPDWIAALLAPARAAPDRPARPVEALSAVLADRTRRSAYAHAALTREAERVASAPEGARSDTLNLAAVSLARRVTEGVLDHDDAVTALTAAGLACGLTAPEVAGTIRSGMRYGAANPADPTRRKAA